MDKILINGDIITMNNKKPIVSSIAIKNNIISKIGCKEKILNYKNKNTEITDLKGKTVVPGFHDTHMHVLSYGMILKDVNLYKAISINDVIKLGKNYIKKENIKQGEWIKGRGWNQENFQDEQRFITKYDLDKISTKHPICFVRTCGHVIAVNSKAMELAGINEKIPQIEGGKIDLDKNGNPIGIFRENARKIILDAIPSLSAKEIKELIMRATNEAAKYGITSIHTDDFKDVPDHFERVIQAYKELNKVNKLKTRIYEQCNLPTETKLNKFLKKGYTTGVGDKFFKIGPLKLLVDGSLGARTAHLCQPYNDDPSTNGIELLSQEELNNLIKIAHSNNMQVAVHAIGDKAMYKVIKSIEKAQKQQFRKNTRHGIIHCQITDENLLKKFKQNNLISYIQPIFLNNDINIVEKRIGKKRAKKTYNWKKFNDLGVPLAMGSDCPVESLDVLDGIYSAVTRMTLKGKPKGGWLPEQKLTVQEALRGFTVWGSYASFEENIKGSIEEGKLADLVILSKNPYKVKAENIKDIKIEKTYLGGRIISD